MRLKIALLAGACALAAATPALADLCDDLLPGSATSQDAKRPITPLDLARLRQIGEPESFYVTHPALSVSPDGTQVAFVIQRGDPQSNSYCVGLAVLDLRSGRPPRLLDQGGELILTVNEYRGSIWNIGYPALIVPRWSPDGRHIAWLRRDSGSTQVWVADAGVDAGADTGKRNSRQLSHAPVDVEQLAWRADGSAVVYAARTGQIGEARDLAREALSGFHYDDRYVPPMSNRPMPSASVPLSSFVADLQDGSERAALPAEASLLPPDEMGKFPSPPGSIQAAGWRAEMKHMTEHQSSPVVLSAAAPDGTEYKCEDAVCAGRMVSMWWEPQGKVLYFQRQEGWANGNSALYRWQPGAGKPRRLFATADLVSNCVQATGRLICLREKASAPQRIVEVDLENGNIRDLYDPNPEFRSIAFGKVRRLEWRSGMGDEVRGDLVLPPGYKPGRRLPLIVTTYTSNGFLRGAMGDEYPIHVFAAHGFAVLSYNVPSRSQAQLAKLKDYSSAAKDGTLDWTDRRRKHTAVMAGVQKVVDLGIADPARVGISGLSDGGSTVAFALINSDRFAAAATSSCCLEPWTIDATTGPAFGEFEHKLGWPMAIADDRAFWATGSVIQNAARVDTPLLMQLSDHEYQLALDVYTALKEHGKPVDMFVYPDSWHFKYQPAQRLAVYQRNLDWFAFWLQGKIDPDPLKAKQYAEWRKLRAAKASAPNPQASP